MKWIEKSVTLTEAVMRRGGTIGRDIALLSTDDRDDVSSMLEAHRGSPQEPSFRLRIPFFPKNHLRNP